MRFTKEIKELKKTVKLIYRRNKAVFNSVFFLIIIMIVLLIPIGISQLINNGFLQVLSADLGKDTWFSFWGSYIGAVAAIILAVINYYQSQVIRRLEARPIVSLKDIKMTLSNFMEVSNSLGPIFVEKGYSYFIDGTCRVDIEIKHHSKNRFNKYLVEKVKIHGKEFIPKEDENTDTDIFCSIYNNSITFFWEYGNNMSDCIGSIFSEENTGPYPRMPIKVNVKLKDKNGNEGNLLVDAELRLCKNDDHEIDFNVVSTNFEYMEE